MDPGKGVEGEEGGGQRRTERERREKEGKRPVGNTWREKGGKEREGRRERREERETERERKPK